MNEPKNVSDPKIPKYQQVAQALLREWKDLPGEDPRTQREMAADHGVHVLTLRHALQWLKQTGQTDVRCGEGASGTDLDLPRIGFPIWANSIVDLDVLRVDGRLRWARRIAWELESRGYQLDVQFVGPEHQPNRKKIARLCQEWSSVVLEPFSEESRIAPDHPFFPMIDRAVLIGALQGMQNNCVCPDFYSAGPLAVGELVRVEARRILYTGRREEPTAHQFLRIASAEAEAARHPGVEILYANGGFHVEEAFSAVKKFFLEGGQCDAILAGSGYAAVGAIRAMRDLGLRCPEDVQLISLGTAPLFTYMVPRPTVITQESHRLGQEVARMAIALSKPGAKPCSNILVPVHLIQGETTGQFPVATPALEPAVRSEFAQT